MAGKIQKQGTFVKLETTFIIAAVALIVGFLGGVIYSTYHSGPPGASRMAAAPPQAQTMPGGESNVPPAIAAKVPELEREAKLNPDSAEAWVALGNAYFDLKDYPKSIDAYQKALAIEPHNADVWTDMGVMYRQSGQPQKALEAFNKAIEADPKHEVSRFNKGVVLMQDLNDAEGALKAWEELVKIDPSATTPNGQPLKDIVERFKKAKEKAPQESKP